VDRNFFIKLKEFIGWPVKFLKNWRFGHFLRFGHKEIGIGFLNFRKFWPGKKEPRQGKLKTGILTKPVFGRKANNLRKRPRKGIP